MKDNDFFWGASVASHQVEGNNYNQWSVWEKEAAPELADGAEKQLGKLENWQQIKNRAESIDNYISGAGVDHYNRYKEDFDILKKLNLNSFRFTIEWSRIQPKEDTWDQQALDHYKDYINELRLRNIEPFLNIWHWTVPIWFAEKGGFRKRKNLKYFKYFIEKISADLFENINYVITLNEPNVYSVFSYEQGLWPPQKKNIFTTIRVYANLAQAHKIAWRVIKKSHPDMKIGVAQQLVNVQPSRPDNLIDEISVRIIRYGWNWWWLNRIRNYQDFVGFNYYFTDYYRGFKKITINKPANDLGWYMNPQGILPLLQKINDHYPNKPIIITENGLADEHDKYRQWWLSETMHAIETAKAQNINLHGYLHWSLLDNFEWAYGWWPKFGLVSVDRENDMKRTIRDSALWWADELKEKPRDSHEEKI
jgi:beta-glucosidase